jgi:hypothetical protein
MNLFGPYAELSVCCCRSGSSELCFHQLCHLIEVLKHLAHHHGRPEKVYVTVLAGRLFTLLPNKHKVQIVEMFPPDTDLCVWQALSVKALPEQLRATVTESVVRSAIFHTDRFLTLPASLELYSLAVCICSLLLVSGVGTAGSQPLLPEHTSVSSQFVVWCSRGQLCALSQQRYICSCI